MADDDRLVKLLEEIRDLQRQHLDTHRTVLRDQEDALRAQQECRSSANRRVGVFGVRWPLSSCCSYCLVSLSPC